MSWRLATDVVGGLIALTALGWRAITSWIGEGDAAAASGLFLAAGAGFVAARLLTSVDLAIVPALITVVGLVVIGTDPDGVYSDRPLDGPWGYSAATGAFFLQCTIAACLLLADRRPWVKPLGLAAVPFAVVPVATGSQTAIVGLIAIPVVLGLRRVFGARVAVISCCTAALAVVAVTTALAASYAPGERSGPIDRAVDATLTERRLERQHDAWEMMTDHPLVGVGGGRYAAESASVARDADAPWAHHDFLQHGAEAGLPGFFLLILLVWWGFLRLKRSMAHRSRTVLVAAGLLGLTVHACTELVFDRPAVTAVALALLGAALRPLGQHRRMVEA